jgi:ATP-dependent DNA ligase
MRSNTTDTACTPASTAEVPRLLTRTGLDWTHKYRPIAAAVFTLPARQAYLDEGLCGVRPDGKTSVSLIQAASDAGNANDLVFFLIDLLYFTAKRSARPEST